MRVRYDKEADTLFIRFLNQPSVESEMIEPGVIVDYSEDNRIVALEILNVSQQIEFLEKLKEVVKSCLIDKSISFQLFPLGWWDFEILFI